MPLGKEDAKNCKKKKFKKPGVGLKAVFILNIIYNGNSLWETKVVRKCGFTPVSKVEAKNV